MGIGPAYGGIRLAEGDEVLTTEHDFYSTHEALRLRAERTGATVRRVALYDDPAQADAGEMVERLASAVTPATRVVAVTWVHSGTGVKLPVADMAAARRDRGRQPLLCVDGSTGWAPRTPLSPTWAATSSWPAPTSGSTGRVAPASSGPRPRRGTSST
jgi:selenocysteine lyase/cysteine desulfurase